MAVKEIILREKIKGLGSEADVVKVKAGYARNFLIPQGKAYEASKENLKQIEDLKAARAAREAEELEVAKTLASKVKATNASFELSTGQDNKAFGSVTSIDIQKKLEEAGVKVDRTDILLKTPIKATGKFDVEIKLHAEVSAKLNVNVAAKDA